MVQRITVIIFFLSGRLLHCYLSILGSFHSVDSRSDFRRCGRRSNILSQAQMEPVNRPKGDLKTIIFNS